jgi:catechol 2,3-dioxygenase-like lactoylglutathione lyase family enzyme
MASARFTQFNLVVRDMEASIAFYRLLGIDIPDGSVWRVGGHGHHVKAGEGQIDVEFDSRALAKAYNHGFAAERGRIVINVAVESREAVDALWGALLEQSVQGLQPPYDVFWGTRYAIVEDPDGNPVGLMSPVDPARRAAPPEL